MTPFVLRKAKPLAFAGAAVLALYTGSCASTAASRAAAAPRPPDAVTRAIESAAADFALGREAALSGDFQCAQFYFGRAVDRVRPEGGGPVASAEIATFSSELYEGIVRYEALAAPSDETATGEDHVSPELQKIETPVEASQEAISEAASAVASDSTGVTYDIPIVVNDGVLKILATFQHDLHDIIGRGLARSGRYVPMIHRVFEQEGIPKDLAQVALIESSFIPHAHSRATAHGIWQFMPRTGRQYGLTSNAVVDERSDPEKATRAAAKHLAYLHDLFHDWYLALAAYNAGEGRVLRAMEKTGLNDFWQLAASGILKPQTQNYVPAVIAATLISKNPDHYGFQIDYEQPLDYETLLIERPVRLSSLSAGSVTLEDLQKLNPELRTEITPRQPEGYQLKVPTGFREAVQIAYADAPTAQPPAFRRHVARRGETLASVARRYRIPLADLAAANSLSQKARLRKGQVVVILKPAEVLVASKHRRKGSVAKAARGGKRSAPPVSVAARSYRVRGGDTLYRIALKNGVTVERLMNANRLRSGGAIKPGDRLRIPSSNSR
ncbi:MAG: transglycosylase SLT domain-containing protein [Acidobacteriota bacterium]